MFSVLLSVKGGFFYSCFVLTFVFISLLSSVLAKVPALHLNLLDLSKRPAETVDRKNTCQRHRQEEIDRDPERTADCADGIAEPGVHHDIQHKTMPEIDLQRPLSHRFREAKSPLRHETDDRHTHYHGDYVAEQAVLHPAALHPDQRVGISSREHADDGKNVTDPVKAHKYSDRQHRRRQLR